MTSPQDMLEALDSLVESHFGDSLASSIVATNSSIYLSIWKQPQGNIKPKTERPLDMTYLPLFYIIGSIENEKLCLKLITYHGKVIDEVSEKDFPMDDENKIGFIGKLEGIKLCRGICFDNEAVNWSLIQPNVLLELLENNIVLRSRQCVFGIFQEDSMVCDSCDCTNIDEDFKENNLFIPETKPFVTLPLTQLGDDDPTCETAEAGRVEIVGDTNDEEYDLMIPKSSRKNKPAKRKGSKRRIKRNAADNLQGNQKKQRVGEKENDLNCEDCTFSTKKQNKLTEHSQKIHDKTCTFQCEQCEYKFAYQRELDKHVSAVHMKIKPFLCNFCSYETAYKSQLSWHINIVHNKVKPFLCEYCPYKTSQKRNLTLHNRCKHEMVKPVKCSYEDCTYETISTSRLTTHIKFVHQKIKPFVCQLCPFATDTNYHLQNHINVRHSTAKPFKCPQCNYEGARKNYLTDHIRAVHDKIKRFKCELCTYETTSKYSLNKHINAVHEKVKLAEEKGDTIVTTATIITSDVVTTTTPITTMPPISSMTPMATVTLNEQGIMQVMHVTAVTDNNELM